MHVCSGFRVLSARGATLAYESALQVRGSCLALGRQACTIAYSGSTRSLCKTRAQLESTHSLKCVFVRQSTNATRPSHPPTNRYGLLLKLCWICMVHVNLDCFNILIGLRMYMYINI